MKSPPRICKICDSEIREAYRLGLHVDVCNCDPRAPTKAQRTSYRKNIQRLYDARRSPSPDTPGAESLYPNTNEGEL
jgi:hypothetical protein